MTADDLAASPSERAAFESYRARTQALLHEALPTAIGRLDWDAARIEQLQVERLRALLATAIERSPFHGRRLRRIDPATFELADFGRLPVMTKAEMMDAFDDVATDRRLTRAAAEEAIARTNSMPVPLPGELVVLASGGSSGQRGLFAFAPPAFAEFACSLMRNAMARTLAAGGMPAGGLRIAFVAAASPIHATGCAVPMLAGTGVTFEPVPVTLPLDTIVGRLNDLQPPLLYGYPSVLARLAREQLAGRLRIAPIGVTATSETLRADLRRAILEGFGVPLVDVYGSSEGLAGATSPDDRIHTFASDSCIVELVDEHDRPVEPGRASASILVTNLFNTVQPLIRYRIEDRFVRRIETEGGHLRAEVQGRAAELLRYGRLTIHPLVIASPLTRNAAVIDHQVRQTARGVDIEVIAARDIDLDALTAEVGQSLAGAGLADPVVRVRVVDDLARDPRTGKLRAVVALAS